MAIPPLCCDSNAIGYKKIVTDMESHKTYKEILTNEFIYD